MDEVGRTPGIALYDMIRDVDNKLHRLSVELNYRSCGIDKRGLQARQPFQSRSIRFVNAVAVEIAIAGFSNIDRTSTGSCNVYPLLPMTRGE